MSLSKSGERLIRVQSEHRVIVKAILKRDPIEAEFVMRRHLQETRQRMFGS
jgi:DNA-binding FadR family transcriptional regulator